jgi:hypothetical protein
VYTRHRCAGADPAGELEAGVRIVVLVKPVPAAKGRERLGLDARMDLASPAPVLHGNDECTREPALRLVGAP